MIGGASQVVRVIERWVLGLQTEAAGVVSSSVCSKRASWMSSISSVRGQQQDWNFAKSA